MRDDLSLLRPIALEYLYEGMAVTENIYSYDGRVLLLAKGITLTENSIRQLREFNPCSRNISVFEKTRQDLLSHGLSAVNTLGQEYLEERVGYTAIADKAGDLLAETRVTGKVSEEDVRSITNDVLDKLHTIDPSLIFQCINAPNPIDEYLRRHSVNVGFLNGLMGKWLKRPDSDIDLLALAGLVHDVGKSKIPTEILNVPRRLTRCEYEVIKAHPIYSYDLLCADSRFPEPVRQAALCHHERMNGSGYPHGLTADHIPLFARITAVSDIYDAMVSKRSYKEATDPFSILAKLANQQFSELDIQLVRLFTDHMPAELVGKSVLLSDGSIGVIKFIVPNDLEHPLVDVNGIVKQMDGELHCSRLILNE